MSPQPVDADPREIPRGRLEVARLVDEQDVATSPGRQPSDVSGELSAVLHVHRPGEVRVSVGTARPQVDHPVSVLRHGRKLLASDKEGLSHRLRPRPGTVERGHVRVVPRHRPEAGQQAGNELLLRGRQHRVRYVLAADRHDAACKVRRRAGAEAPEAVSRMQTHGRVERSQSSGAAPLGPGQIFAD